MWGVADAAVELLRVTGSGHTPTRRLAANREIRYVYNGRSRILVPRKQAYYANIPSDPIGVVDGRWT